MSTTKKLAEYAIEQSKGRKLTKGESKKTNKGALIYAYSGALTSWQDIEGVCLKRIPKPVTVPDVDKKEVKKMMIISNLLNDECHCFNNRIILN